MSKSKNRSPRCGTDVAVKCLPRAELRKRGAPFGAPRLRTASEGATAAM